MNRKLNRYGNAANKTGYNNKKNATVMTACLYWLTGWGLGLESGRWWGGVLFGEGGCYGGGT